MKLSPAQEEAMKKVTNEWQNSYSLKISRVTLNALVEKGLLKSKSTSDLSSLFSPCTSILYRKK